MSSFQRAWRSVTRKPVKSILLLLVILVISLFLLAGMASKNASVETQDITRQAIGAALRLEGNEAYRHVRMEKLWNEIGEMEEGSKDGFHKAKWYTAYGLQWRTWTDNSFETLLMEDIKKIAAVPGISSYNITTVATVVNPVNFKRIEDTDNDQHTDAGGVTLIGNLDMDGDFNILSGNVTISEGRMITAQDKNVCVISEELAAENGLAVGDKLRFNDYRDREGSAVYEAEIRAIYQTKQKMTPIMSGDTYRSENIIFTDLRFPEKAEGCEGNPLFQYACFQVEDVNRYDAVKEAVKKLDIGWERYDLIDNNGNLETMSSNFKDLEKISNILVWVVAAASFVILFLIFVFWIRNRTQEVGILLSIGTPKRSILGQLFLEALMIGLIAFALSFLAAPAVSNAAAGYLALQQVQQAAIQGDMSYGKVATEYEESEQTVTGVKVEITATMAVTAGAGIVLLIGASVLTAGISLLRKSPKSILSEMS